MIRRPPRSTRTDPLFPYTTLFRSSLSVLRRMGIGDDQHQRLASRLADADPRAFIKPRRHARFQILLCVVRPDDAGARDDIIDFVMRDRVDADCGADVQGAFAKFKAARGGDGVADPPRRRHPDRSEEHTSELQSLMRLSYAVFSLKKKNSINT